MITTREALIEFNESIDSGHALMPSHEAWLLAVHALKKATPKLPKSDGNMHSYCPLCNELVYVFNLYCQNCGQHIDWSGRK